MPKGKMASFYLIVSYSLKFLSFSRSSLEKEGPRGDKCIYKNKASFPRMNFIQIGECWKMERDCIEEEIKSASTVKRGTKRTREK